MYREDESDVNKFQIEMKENLKQKFKNDSIFYSLFCVICIIAIMMFRLPKMGIFISIMGIVGFFYFIFAAIKSFYIYKHSDEVIDDDFLAKYIN